MDTLNSGFDVTMSCFFNINTYAIFKYQLSAQQPGYADQHNRQSRHVQAPGQDIFRDVVESQHEVKGGQRKQGHSQNAMCPGSNQTPDTANGKKINSTGESGYRTTDYTDCSQPVTGPCPKRIVGKK